MFNLKTARIVFKRNDDVESIPKVKIKKDYQYVITRKVGVGNMVVITVYDRREMRYVASGQTNIKHGDILTEKFRKMYRNNLFKDEINNDNDRIFEF